MGKIVMPCLNADALEHKPDFFKGFSRSGVVLEGFQAQSLEFELPKPNLENAFHGVRAVPHAPQAFLANKNAKLASVRGFDRLEVVEFDAANKLILQGVNAVTLALAAAFLAHDHAFEQP